LIKSANTTRNTADETVEDPDFTFNCTAGKVYLVEFFPIISAADATADFKIAMLSNSNLSGYFRYAVVSYDDVFVHGTVQNLSTLTYIGTKAGGVKVTGYYRWTFICTANTQFKLGWNSRVSGSNTTMHAGSTLWYEEIG
jgi:hypothetical protein